MAFYTSTFEIQVNSLIAAEFEARIEFTNSGGRNQIGDIEIGVWNPKTKDVEYQDAKHTPDFLRFQVIAELDSNDRHDTRMYAIWRREREAAADEFGDWKRDQIKDLRQEAAQ
jgi:hypothetical protein